MSSNVNDYPVHSIAVIGMAGRFPGADGIDEYWRNLRDGKESIRHFSEDELRESNLPETVISDPNYVKARGIIDGVESFDAAFFGLSPRQARFLDPQHRVWLECVHEALEDAGHSMQNSEKIVGVFAGARESTYLLSNLCIDRDSQERLLSLASTDAHQIFLNNDRDSIATRTSFLFDFSGPSINVQSACSTSLVAVAQACWALANYQCDVSIAGGVCVTFPTIRGYYYQEEGIYSPDGHCRAFDAKAKGTVFGDGVGAVVLKRLDDAFRDGSRIDAIIRGWAVNNDGADKASFTAPSVNGQAEVIALAQAMAAIEPTQVGYIETHGTGTQVGDPIEVAALTKAFNRQPNTSQFCGLGSVKTNIGHLDTASGIAGLIKTVLALKHQELPPNLHFETSNPQIDFLHSPFYVVNRFQEWHRNGTSRVAGVSSLGVGGTNCHVVLEEAPERKTTSNPRERAVLLTISAKTKEALTDLKSRYQRYLSENTEAQLSDIAFTTNIGRSHYDWRLAVAGESIAEVADKLDDNSCQLSQPKIDPDRVPVIGFLFTGQGAQYAQMGRQLYDTEPEFRFTLERCNELLRPYLDQPLLAVLYSDSDSYSLLDRTDYTQPALFAIEYALAELWRSWGIQPSWVMGHSVGEYVAACVAGVFSLEDGLRLVAERGRLMNALPREGRMVAVFTDLERATEAVQPFASQVAIAALNSPQHVVISGASKQVQAIVEQLQREKVHCRDLQVSHAFHSPLIEPVLTPLERCVGELKLQRPSLGFISNLSGEPASDELTTAAYWRDHSRHPVQFAAGVKTMAELGCQIFIEIGPHAVLTRLGREILPNETVWLPSLRRNESNWHSLSEAMGQLYVRHVNIDWLAFNRDRHCQLVRLPTYPFQREHFWIENVPREKVDSTLASRRVDAVDNPMLGERLRLPGSEEIRFETYYRRVSPWYLQDHRLFETLVVPGASHLAMLVQAAESMFGQCACRFEELVFVRPILLPEDSARYIQLIFSADSQENGKSFQLMSAATGIGAIDTGAWSVHMTGRVKVLKDNDSAARTSVLPIDKIRNRAKQTLSGPEFYSNVWGNASGTGNVFKWIESIWKGDEEAIAKTKCPVAADDGLYYRLHPGLVEAGFQVLHCCKTFETPETITRDGVIYVPFSVDELFCYPTSSEVKEIWCYAKLREFHTDNVVADIYLSDQSGRIVAEMIGLCLRKLLRSAIMQKAPPDSWPRVKGEREEPVRSAKLDPSIVSKFVLEDPADVSVEELGSMLLTYIQQQAAHVSGYPESKFVPDSSLVPLGFDSLMAIMLTNRIKTDLGFTLSMGRILSSSTIQMLGDELHQQWLDKARQRQSD
jgi:acyl transferase domain-containing protein/acyl carrier protein